MWLVINGTPEGIRTPGLLIRSQALYPAELRVHITQKGVRGKSHKHRKRSSQGVKKMHFICILDYRLSMQKDSEIFFLHNCVM